MEVTLQDIAKELNVSAQTVSRSLRHDRLINPETRARVNEAARRLGYTGRVRRPRRPVTHDDQTNKLGLVLRCNTLEAAQVNDNLMKMMAGIMSVTDENALQLKVHTLSSIQQPNALNDPSLHHRALIVHGSYEEQQLSFLADRVPIVSLGRSYRNLPIDAAVGDNVEGVHDLVAHLVKLGHRRLAWVGAEYESTFMQSREIGFMQGCRTYCLEMGNHTFFGPEIYRGYDIHDTSALVEAVDSGVTGFVCGNDSVATKVIEALEAAGKRVPHDVSVTGFDSWDSAKKTRAVTSIDPSFFEIGKVAARLALGRLAHPMDKPCIVSVRGQLVVGDTTATPKGSDKQ